MTAGDRFAQDFREARADQPLGTRNEIITGPVADWATDFYHLEPEWAADPFPIWDDLRAALPDRAHRAVRRRLAADAPRGRRGDRLRHRALHVAVDRHQQTSGRRASWRPSAAAPPISSDPPFHQDARRLLLPAFSAAVGQLEPSTRAYCHALIDAIRGAGRRRRRRRLRPAHPGAGHRRACSASRRRTADGSVSSSRTRLEGVNLPLEERIARMATLVRLPAEQIHDHIANPRDDLTTLPPRRRARRPASSIRRTSPARWPCC